MSFLIVAIYLIPLCLRWQLPIPSDFQTKSMSLPVLEALRSNEYLLSLVASASMSVHMLVDMVGHGILSNRTEFFNYRDSLSNLFILISLLVPDFIQLFLVIPYQDPLLFHVIHRVRNVLILFATFGFLVKLGGKMWRSIGVLLAILFANIGFIIKFYGFFVTEASSYTRYSVISAVFLAIGTILLFIRTLSWIKQMMILFRSGQNISSDEYCCNVYLTAFWMSTIWFWSLSLQNSFPNWYKFNTNSAIQLNVIFSAYYILIVVFQRHVAIREAVTYSVSVL